MPAESTEVQNGATETPAAGRSSPENQTTSPPSDKDEHAAEQQGQEKVDGGQKKGEEPTDSAPSSRARSRGSPRKTASRGSMRSSRATPPPKLRRRQSSKGEVSQSESDGETAQSSRDGKSTPASATADDDEAAAIKPVVSEIVEETPSAIQLDEAAGTSSKHTMSKEETRSTHSSTAAARPQPVQSTGQASNAATQEPTAVEPSSEDNLGKRQEVAMPPPSPTPGSTVSPSRQPAEAAAAMTPNQSLAQYYEQTGTSPLDTLPSSPTRSRVSAAMTDPQSASRSVAVGDAGRHQQPDVVPRFSPARATGAQSQALQSKARQRGGASVELAKTMSQTAKERPLIQKAHSQRFQPTPPPEPDDSLSETKTAVIRRVQDQLQKWETQLDHIQAGRIQSDKIHKHALQKREGLIRELKSQNDETEKQRKTLDEERARLAEQLLITSDDLVDKETMLDQAQEQLQQYEETCQELEEQKATLEAEVSQLDEELQQNEALRKRLNEQVTQLQGQLAIEEQRSRFCTIL